MDEKHETGLIGLADRIGGMLFRCPRGRHERSFKHVTAEGDRYVSKCRSCGVRMVRLAKRKWIVDPNHRPG